MWLPHASVPSRSFTMRCALLYPLVTEEIMSVSWL